MIHAPKMCKSMAKVLCSGVIMGQRLHLSTLYTGTSIAYKTLQSEYRNSLFGSRTLFSLLYKNTAWTLCLLLYSLNNTAFES